MESLKSHILVVDDDEGIRSLLKQFLNENGYLVNTASNALEAKEKISIIKFDLLVLDIMMPGKSGLEFISENKNNLNVPIILLTAKGEASERVEGLETGADDYLPKPFEPKELLLRINNILKKTKKVNLKHVLEFGSIKIDLNKLMITNQNSNFKINNTEKTILEKMINNPGKVFSRIDIGNLIKIAFFLLTLKFFNIRSVPYLFSNFKIFLFFIIIDCVNEYGLMLLKNLTPIAISTLSDIFGFILV